MPNMANSDLFAAEMPACRERCQCGSQVAGPSPRSSTTESTCEGLKKIGPRAHAASSKRGYVAAATI